MLFWYDGARDDVASISDRVRRFYEENPFPAYAATDDAGVILRRGRSSPFTRMLDEEIAPSARILECGCGTGQLSNFLALGSRSVIGSDLSMSSLRMAHDFKVANGIPGVAFVQMNLFHPAFAPGTFDVVISLGVLHHTADPSGGVRRMAQLVTSGGFVVVGVYHRFARVPTDLRRLLRRSPGAVRRTDPDLKERGAAPAREVAWFNDQYRHPYETKHRYREVVGWMEAAGLSFVSSIPRWGDAAWTDGDRLFEPRPGPPPRPNLAGEALAAFRGRRDGGLFVVVARKP